MSDRVFYQIILHAMIDNYADSNEHEQSSE